MCARCSGLGIAIVSYHWPVPRIQDLRHWAGTRGPKEQIVAPYDPELLYEHDDDRVRWRPLLPLPDVVLWRAAHESICEFVMCANTFASSRWIARSRLFPRADGI